MLLLLLLLSVWGSTYQSNLKRLKKKRLKKKRVNNANPILEDFKIEDIIKPQIGKVMYLYKNGLLPGSFNDMFLLNCDVHSYNTRSKNALHLPYCRANVRAQNI